VYDTTLSSPVLAYASGVPVSGSIVCMEVWVDGVKIYSSFGSNILKTYLNLPAGLHRFDYIVVDGAGNQVSETTYAAVQ
jgi:hypothetical protein